MPVSIACLIREDLVRSGASNFVKAPRGYALSTHSPRPRRLQGPRRQSERRRLLLHLPPARRTSSCRRRALLPGQRWEPRQTTAPATRTGKSVHSSGMTSDNPPIIADDTRSGVWVGTTFISGFVDDSTCVHCGANRIYDDRHDAYLCPRCNLWLEDGCTDALCNFCANRPATPLPARAAHR